MRRQTACKDPKASKRRGATMVEFVVVVPIFFMLLMVAMEFAFLGTIRSTADNAAYEAARKLVIPGATAQEGVDEAEFVMGVVGVSSLDVTVTPTSILDNTQEVTVNVSIPYADNAMLTPLFLSDVVIESEITMQTERYGGIASQ